MVIGRLGDLAVDAEQRVQRGHRVLQDHRDLAADVAHLALAQHREVLAGELNPAADDARRRRQQADDRLAQRGLAAAAFADHAERLAFVQIEVTPSTALTIRSPPKVT